jgi:tetratricopeptide (TPR) repeat protein
MYRFTLILAAIFSSLNIDAAQAIGQAKTKEEIGHLAESLTLRIETQCTNGSIREPNEGSGVILQKQGDTYAVITSAHVLCNASSFRLTTPDGKVHDSLSFKKAPGNLDLAVIKFSSKNSYPLAEIGTSVSLELGSEIYVAGFPEATRTINSGVFRFTAGEVTGKASRPNKDGYSLIYNSVTIRGMSGGPVLNGEGKLIAIHGQGDRTSDGLDQKTGFNSGITIELFGTVAADLGVQPKQQIAALPVASNLNAADYLLSGNEKEDKGDYQGALADYNQAIKIDPKYALLYNNRGYLKMQRLNDVNGALADFDRSISIKPNSALAYNNRGFLKEEKLNDFKGALADYNKSLQIDPTDATVYSNRGLLKAEKMNDAQGAMDDYNKAISIDSKHLNAHINRGSLREKLNDLKGALADYNQALIIDPKYAAGYNLRGLLKAEKMNDPQGALADYNQALIIDPKDAVVYLNRGVLKDDVLNDPSGALSDYNQVIALDQQYALAYFRRGLLRNNRQETSGAIADYNQAIILDPKYALAYNNRGLVKLESLDDINGALADFDRAITLDSSLTNSYYNRGVLKLQRTGEIQGALSDFNQVIILDPKYADAYWNRAVLKRDNGSDRSGAIADFRKALQLYREQGKNQDAQETITELKKLGVNA